MKIIYSLIILAYSFVPLIFTAEANAQFSAYSITNIPAELLEGADEVVRQKEINFNILSATNSREKVKKVITLLNSDSNAEIQAIHYDDNSKIHKLSARIYDALGQEIRKVKANDFIDHAAVSDGSMYSDSRYKYIELIHNSYPYTIEIEYEKSYKKTPVFPYGSLQSYGTAIENFKLSIKTDKDLPLHYKVRNAELEPVIKEIKDEKLYTWEATNLPAIKQEPYAPYSDLIQPMILATPEFFQFDDYHGSMASWESFGKFMYNINEGRDQLSPEMLEKVQTMIAGKTSDREKIQVLYDYLQENMRYVSVQLGIGGWQAFDAEYVEHNKYGDCKALSNFMKSMLKAVGIESHWVLIYRGSNYKPTLLEDFVTPGTPNHMIINVPSEDLYLECTSNNYPLGYLGVDNHDRQVLLITEEGGKLSRTPTYEKEQNITQRTATFELEPGGQAIIKERSHYHGPSHDKYRQWSNYYSKEDIEKYYSRGVTLPAFNLDHFSIEHALDQPRSTIEFNATVPRYASKAGRRIFLPVNKLNPFSSVPKLIEDRKHPIHVNTAYQEEDMFTFLLPDGYSLESVPQEAIDISSAYGHYQVKITQEGNKLIYERKLEINKVELPADKYEEFRNFYKEIAKADTMKVVLVQDRA